MKEWIAKQYIINCIYHGYTIQNYGYGASVLWPEVIIRLVMDVYEINYSDVSMRLESAVEGCVTHDNMQCL